MDSKSCIIYLISCVLHDQIPDLHRREIDLKKIFQLSKFYGVENLVLSALESIEIFTAEELNEWKSLCETLQYQNIIQKLEYQNILKELTSGGIKVLPLKGCVIKPMYPREDFRKMGDIDLLIEDGKWEKARSIMQKMGYQCEDYGSANHDAYKKKPWMYVELHRSLFSEKSEFYDSFKNIWNAAVMCEDNSYIFMLTWNDFYIYFMAHLAKHCRISGSGVRSVVDTYIFLQKYGSVIDRGYVCKALQKIGIWEFACEMEKLSEKWFSDAGVVEQNRDSGSLEALILRSGIHGSSRQRMMNHVDQAAKMEDSLKTAKRKFALSCVFAGYENMKYRYPVLERLPFLLPALWVSRCFRILLFERKKIADFRKSLSEVKERQTWMNIREENVDEN